MESHHALKNAGYLVIHGSKYLAPLHLHSFDLSTAKRQHPKMSEILFETTFIKKSPFSRKHRVIQRVEKVSKTNKISLAITIQTKHMLTKDDVAPLVASFNNNFSETTNNL